MNQTWKQWEGHIVEGEFPLQKFLGGSAHSAVFLTERGKRQPEKAAIKLIALDPGNAEAQLARWAQAARLFHPCLLRIFAAGRCRLGEIALLYVVMEYAEEDLSQIIPQRSLTSVETENVLRVVLDALAYIHSQGVVHGHLKPSNIMAIGDQVKLSTDSFCPAGEIGRLTALRDADVYDPPETKGGTMSPASDLWSLAVTMVEMLAQQPPSWNRASQAREAEPTLPGQVPETFRDIALHSLRADPRQRWTVAQATARLRSTSAAAPKTVAAAPSPEPGQVPERLRPTKPALYTALARWPYLVPLAVGGLALLFWGGSRMLVSHPQVQVQPGNNRQSTVSEQPQAPGGAAPTSATRGTVRSTHGKSHQKPSPASPSASPAVGSEAGPRGSTRTSARGAIVRQVLPDVSQSARNTIQGHVRVNVKVTADASGNVVRAALESAGPSKYFARQALQAAQGWKFVPAEGSASREWILRFAFSRTGTDVVPEQVR